MMGRKSLVAFLGMAVLLVGGLLFAGPAGAITTKTPAICTGSGGDNVIFILGEDGRLWYTTTETVDARGFQELQGPAAQPFKGTTPTDAATGTGDNADGFANATTFGGAVTNVGIWVPAPGAGSFQDGPACIAGGADVCANCGTNFGIVLPGLDNNVWMTILDGGDSDFDDGAILTAQGDANGALGVAAAATNHSGFPEAGFKSGSKAVGIFVPFPLP